jgi:ribonuclease HII
LSFLTLINDSKKVSKINREKLSSIIKSYALSYAIAEIDNNTIDEKGIAWCNNQIFILSVNKLQIEPDLVLSDGYPIKNCKYRNEFTIKADEKSATVACASIIAKAYRDNLMEKNSKIYPCYGFDHNAGYGTKEHINAILENGPCPIHRKSFIRNIVR